MTEASSGRRGRYRSATSPTSDCAEATSGKDRRPRAGTTPLLVRDHRSEYAPAANPDQVRDPEQENARPQPVVARELTPPFTQIVEESSPLLSVPARCHPDPRQQYGAQAEARRVRGEPDARATDDQQHAPDPGARDRDEIARESLERIRLLQSLRAHRLRDQTHLGRDDQPGAGAVDDGEGQEKRNRRLACQHNSRRHSLRRALNERRAGEHEVARETI